MYIQNICRIGMHVVYQVRRRVAHPPLTSDHSSDMPLGPCTRRRRRDRRRNRGNKIAGNDARTRRTAGIRETPSPRSKLSTRIAREVVSV